MSQIVQVFDPSLKTSDTFPAAQSAAQGSLHFWNESPFGLQIVLQDGSNLYVPAWFHRHYCGQIQRGNITWQKQNTLASNIPPLSQVIIEVYNSGEDFPADGPLTRQTNIGNASTVATAATSIQNDGNAVGTSLVEATVGAELSSAVTWTNDAKLINGNAAHPGFVQFDNDLISSDGSGNLTAHGLTANNFLVAQNTLTVLNKSSFDNNLAFTDGSGHLQVASLRLTGGGGLSRISKVTTPLSNGKTTIAHGLGVVPDIVLAIARTTAPPISIISYDPASLTSTHVDIWANGLFNGDIITIKL